MELTGYADRRSVAPGETVRFMVSTDAPFFDADVTRLVHGDRNSKGPGFKEVVVQPDIAREVQGRHQVAHAGSYVWAPDVPPLPDDWSVTAWIFPTLPSTRHPQGVVSRVTPDGMQWSLSLDETGTPTFVLGCDAIRSNVVLASGKWAFVGAVCSSQQRSLSIYVKTVDTFGEQQLAERPAEVRKVKTDQPGHIVMAAQDLVDGYRPGSGARGAFNGKIEAPTLHGLALSREHLHALSAGRSIEASVHVAWKFGPACATIVPGAGKYRVDGIPVNLPVRAVTGRFWDATSALGMELRPEQYAALEFHENAIEDAGWVSDVSIVVPPTWRSGVFALRTRANGHEDRIPFVVRPPRHAAHSRIAVLLPTMTYLAYANERMTDSGGFDVEAQSGLAPQHDPLDAQLNQHPEWGISLYDHHPGGVGCSLVSWLRPVPNMRPDYRMWLQGAPRGLGADLYLIDWLDAKDFHYDVLTDEDLHQEGNSLFSRYQVVLTGSHPEYWTSQMMRAVEEYLREGGRIVYLGGNGFYWVTSVDPDRLHVMEVRRGQAGTRSWESRAGEVHHGTTGELGGLWKHRGLPPHKVVGVGFAAQGWDARAVGYTRTAASEDPRIAFAFDGVEDNEVVGDFGLIMNGAVGDEIDRADVSQGTPCHALVVASSQPLSKHYLAAVENLNGMIPKIDGSSNRRLVRADMTFFETPNDGAVFSVGSINWMGALSHNNHTNNVSRITENVVRRFLRPGPLT